MMDNIYFYNNSVTTHKVTNSLERITLYNNLLMKN